MYILVFILILAVLVLIHELGHFIAAKKNGVLVEEFGFGYPPRLIGKKIGETIYSLNLIPIGGFVKIFGEDADEEEKSKTVSKTRSFNHKKPWQKCLILISGVMGNFLLGWILISFLFTQGVPSPANKVIIEKVVKKSPAEIAGLKNNDAIIKAIYDKKEYLIKTTTDLVGLTNKFAGQNIIFIVQRSDKLLNINITPQKNPPARSGPLGVVITSYIVKKYSWYQAPFFGLIEAFNITKEIIVQLFVTLIGFLSFKKPSVDFTGPIGIAKYTGDAIKFGLSAVLELMALLSLNLAVINIFPFPALDGGRLVFVVYEWITKKRVNKNLEKYLNMVGFVLLLALAALISIKDIIRLTK